MTDRAQTQCLCWAIAPIEGVVIGATSHDAPIAFDGITFSPASGDGTAALEQVQGLAVDNGEIRVVLPDEPAMQAALLRGDFDGAEVTCWRLDWHHPEARSVWFRGVLGDLSQEGSTFRAELRGLSEYLGRSFGRRFSRQCNARLGDAACGYGGTVTIEATVIAQNGDGSWLVETSADAEDGAFAGGDVREAATELSLRIVSDIRLSITSRRLSVSGAGALTEGCSITLAMRCDGAFSTCRNRFTNAVNFQGFPDLPGEDWLSAVPSSKTAHQGLSRRRGNL